jgi:Zn-dependent protease with chaperone function
VHDLRILNGGLAALTRLERRPAMRAMLALLVLALAGCTVSTGSPRPPIGVLSGPAAAPQPVSAAVGPDIAARNFATVVRRVEPVAEQVCRQELPRGNCDFLIVVDDRPGAPPNAFQTLDRNGRPVIGFTLALVADARNQDELAFILGHEAAHHIAGHIPLARQSASTGALLGGLAATLGGLDAQSVDAISQLGATVGARQYSKQFELEADALGTVIAARAGYDPVRGAAYFSRIPDPGDRFLGSHPPNADRIRVVQSTAARIGAY